MAKKRSNVEGWSQSPNWFETFLELPNGIPSQDTFNRVIARLDEIEFRTCFLHWINAASELIGGQVIAKDGKVLRR